MAKPTSSIFPPSRDPIAAKNHAVHSALSRVIASVINERLALGVFNRIQHRGVLLPLSCRPCQMNDNQSITFPTGHPLYADAFEDGSDTDFLRISFLDPEDILKRSPCDYRLMQTNGTSRLVETGTEIMRIVQAWNNIQTSGFEAVMDELTNTLENAYAVYLCPPLSPSLQSDYNTWEKSLVEGHSTHPMFLSRTPLSSVVGPLPAVQLITVTIHFALIAEDKVVLTGDFGAEIQPLLDILRISTPVGFVIVPIHEYQLRYLATTSIYADIKLLPQTCIAKAQASIRTVTPWNPSSNTPLLPHTAFKLPIAIRTTSALRTISPWSTSISHELNSHWPRMDRIDPTILHICRERAGLSLLHSNFDIAKHFACIVREDPTRWVREGESVALCAALVECAGGGWDDEAVVISAWKLDSHEKRSAFLENYTELLFKCFLPPLIVHGFGFEAHGQNTLVHYEIATGKLLGFSIRDLAGIRIWQEAMEASTGHRVSLIPNSCNEATSLKEVHAKSFHVLIQSHLYRIVRALNLHADRSGWRIVRAALERHIPLDSALRRDWLETQTAQYKCFLRMKIDGLYRDYIYEDCPNPLELGSIGSQVSDTS